MNKEFYQEIATIKSKYGAFVDLSDSCAILGLSETEIFQLVKENQLTTISPIVPKFQVATLVGFMYNIPQFAFEFQGSNAISALPCHGQYSDNLIERDWVFMAKLRYGEGSLYTSKNRTKFHVAFYYMNLENEKARKVLTADSEEEVLEKMRVFKENLQLLTSEEDTIPAVRNKKVVTFSQVLNEYMTMWLAKEKTFNSKRDKKYLFENYITPYFGTMEIDKITSTQVQEFYQSIGKNEDGELKSESLLKRIRSNLNAIFDFAYNSQGYIQKLPTYKVELPKGKVTNKEERFFERQELVEIFTDLYSHEKYFLLAKILMGTGLRSQELVALQWKNIDLEAKTIKITNAMVQGESVNGKSVQNLGDTKTKHSVRTIHVGSVVIESLKQWKAYLKTEKIDEKAKKLGTEEFLILSNKGTIQNASDLHKNYIKYIKNHGTFKHHANWYSFRHCFASYNHSQGVDQMVIKRFMGHSGDNLTERVYTSIPKEQLEKGADIYNQFLVELFENVEELVKELAEKKKQEELIILDSEENNTDTETIETTEVFSQEETEFEVFQRRVNLRKVVTKKTKSYRKKS